MKQLSRGLFRASLMTAALAVFMLASAFTPKAAAPAPVQDDEDIIAIIIKSIPSPLEISTLLREVESSYNKADLNDHKKVGGYTSSFQKAINLGIYSTDLGFANIYGKNQDALNYLSSVRDLAEGLSVDQFFDYEAIRELTQAANNLEKLLQITQRNFEEINDHLKSQKREHLSVLMLTGGFIEAVHLMTQAHARNADEKLRERIGEQKLVLERIMLLMDVYRNKPQFEGLIRDMNELSKVYENVEIEIEYLGTETKIVDGVPTVIDNTRSTVIITNNDITRISSLLTSIRKKLTS